jgi:hypothetical protein
MPETYGLINAVVAFVSSSLAGLLLLLAVGGLTFKIGYASAAKLGSAIKYDLWLALFTACFIFVIGWWVAGLFGMFLADPKVLMAFAPATVAAFGHPEMPPLVNMTWFRGAAIALNVIFAGWISKRLKEKLEAEPDE